MTKTVGVVLSGCGVYDGAEIHEAVLTLLALDRAGAKVVCAAPNIAQTHVVNHLTGSVATTELRNVLVESARIARGAIRDINSLGANDLDAAVFPGGFGAAKNLSNYAFEGQGMTVDPEVARFVRELHAAGKPLGFICIAPVIAAKLLGHQGVKLTIGSDAKTAADIESFGAQHQGSEVRSVVIDRERKVASTAAYMLGKSIGEAADGIERLVDAVLKMA